MAAIGGPIRRVSFDGRNYVCQGDNEAQRDLGGYTNTPSPNGDGQTGVIMQAVRTWKMASVVLTCDDDQGDQKALQDAANSGEPKKVNFTFASGSVFGGEGNIEGEINWSNNNSRATVTFSGFGQLRKQN